ncbi:hypothetical protein B0I37DRAFT_350600 [Chaetomium sp. MPI-CAGE-AT-0009]|nr:hypothetical protein B0I37DRAFT_350600 [Chaetomium sp. MPI-CAGE-AT-0009]
MSITLSPVPSLDLAKPTRVKVRFPLGLLAHFDPAVDLSTERDDHLLHRTGPAARVAAENLSMALFGSTEALSDPFIHLLGGFRDGPVESVAFTLNHKIAHDGLDPVYLHVMGELVDGRAVFGVEEVTGEWRQTLNYRHEVEEADMRRSLLRPEGEEEATGSLVWGVISIASWSFTDGGVFKFKEPTSLPRLSLLGTCPLSTQPHNQGEKRIVRRATERSSVRREIFTGGSRKNEERKKVIVNDEQKQCDSRKLPGLL